MNSLYNLKIFLSKVIDAIKIPDFLIKRSNSRIILGYHRILSESEAYFNFIQNCMWTSTESFERQILWMKKIGNIVSLDRIIDFTQNDDKPLFSITFDDGWKDNYLHAFPILKKYNIPATIFLATDAVSTGAMFWTEELYHKTGISIKKNNKDKVLTFLSEFNNKKTSLKNIEIESLLDFFLEELKIIEVRKRSEIINEYYNYIKVDSEPIFGHTLTWDDVREMQKFNISFGSHTHSHLILQGADTNNIWSELVVSKEIIEKQISEECKWFCYPNARYNDNDHEILRRTGYQYGVTLDCSVLKKDASLFYLPRFIVYEDISKILSYIKLRILNFPYY